MTHCELTTFIYYFYCILSYDDAIEQLIDYQRIPVGNIEKIEIGPESTLFKSTNFNILRIHYSINEESGYFYSFKSSCFRFFNNLVITMKSNEEQSGYFLYYFVLFYNYNLIFLKNLYEE